jgi:hypothetical protein
LISPKLAKNAVDDHFPILLIVFRALMFRRIIIVSGPESRQGEAVRTAGF